MYALIRFHFKEDPDNYSTEKLAMRWTELEWVLKQEAKKVSGE